MAETLFANYETVAAYLDTAISPYFRAAAIMPNLVHLVNFQNGSDQVKLRKAGSLTATLASEATAHAIATYDETTPATLQAIQIKVYVELSDKALKFANANPQSLAAEAGRAIAQKFDTDAMALFDSMNGGTQVGSSGVDCSPQILLQATYVLAAQNIPGPYVFVLHPTQIYDVQDDLITSGAVMWSNPAQLDIMSGQAPLANGWKGRFLDLDVYASTNTESVNAAADWAGACFSPQHALAAGFAGGIETEIGRSRSKGVTELAVTLWYDVKEYNDLAGVSIETDQ